MGDHVTIFKTRQTSGSRQVTHQDNGTHTSTQSGLHTSEHDFVREGVQPGLQREGGSTAERGQSNPNGLEGIHSASYHSTVEVHPSSTSQDPSQS